MPLSFLQQQHNFLCLEMLEEPSGYFLKVYSVNVCATNFQVKFFYFFYCFLNFPKVYYLMFLTLLHLSEWNNSFISNLLQAGCSSPMCNYLALRSKITSLRHLLTCIGLYVYLYPWPLGILLLNYSVKVNIVKKFLLLLFSQASAFKCIHQYSGPEIKFIHLENSEL